MSDNHYTNPNNYSDWEAVIIGFLVVTLIIGLWAEVDFIRSLIHTVLGK